MDEYDKESELLFFSSPKYSASTNTLVRAFLFPNDSINQLLREGLSLSPTKSILVQIASDILESF